MNKLYTTLAFLVIMAGVRAQTTLPTSWNFTTPPISTPPTGWTLGLGTNGNLTYSTGVGDNLAARLDANAEYIQIYFTDKPGSVSYYIRGTGISPSPSFTGSFKVQESDNGSTWNDVKVYTTMSGTFARSEDNLALTSRYVRFYYQEKQSGSNVSIDSILVKPAPAPPTPVINIKKGTTSIVPGSELFVGNTASTQLTLENNGTLQTLKIDSIRFTGVAASEFSVTGIPDSVASKSTANFSLNYTQSATGSRKATMLVYSNDPDKSLFAINVYAIGGTLATEPVNMASNLSFSLIKSYGFKGSFAPAQEVEHYLILRKKGSPVVETPVDGHTYMKGDYIGDAQVEAIVDSAVSFSPNYIFAMTTYYYAIVSFNGKGGYENYASAGLSGSVTTMGRNPGSYYSGIDPFSNDFVTKLSARINPHDTIYYSNYIPRLVTPWLARDTSGGQKVVTCVYTGHQYVYNEPFQWASGNNGAVLTREHSYCQSWMPSNQGNPDWPNAAGTTKELPEYNDLHHLFPVHQVNANARRSNNPYGIVVTPSYVSPTGFGKLGKDSTGNATVYEPRPDQKGDAARALFYMAVCYNGINGNSWAIPSQQALELLKSWHRQDPPDAFEIARNEYIASVQGNRNPFIDFPEWADRINFSNMTYVSLDSAKVPVIHVLRPTASEKWEKGSTAVIKWESLNVDSVQILFSTDSMKTFSTLFSSWPASNDSVAFVITSVFAESKGIVIVKDKASVVADTSDYFNLSKLNGIDNAIDNGLQLTVYPVPVKGNELFIECSGNLKESKGYLFDLRGICLKSFSVESKTTVNVEDLSQGIYFIKVESVGGFKTIRFTKE